MALSEQQIRDIVQDEMSNKVDRYIFDKLIQINNGQNIQLGRNNGTKIGTASDQKLGFFNTTPIIKQTTISQTAATFAANTSGISDDTATWGGYTIGDLVAILKAFGLIQ